MINIGLRRVVIILLFIIAKPLSHHSSETNQNQSKLIKEKIMKSLPIG
jgi:hypothetical protein